MTLKEKIYQLIITDIKSIKEEGGPEKFFKKYLVGGVYLMPSQFDVEDVGELMKDAASASAGFIKKCRQATDNQLMMCVDFVTLSNGLRLFESCAAATEDENYHYEYGKMLGMMLNNEDVDIIYGPCVDMIFDPLADFHSSTSTKSPEFNVKMHTQIVKAIQERGVATTVKHFPGQGTYHVNFHYAPGKNTLDFDTWLKTYGYVYKKMIEADTMCVMTSHLTLESYTTEKEDGFPPIATYSRKITMDLLKGELGFKGAVVTDALVMGGMAVGNQALEAAQAFKCGADFLLWAPLEVADIIEEKLLSGEIPMSRLDDALQRIQRVKDFVKNNKKKAPTDIEKDAEKFIMESFEKAAQLLINENNALPLKRGDKILVIGNAPDDTRMKNTELFADELKNLGYDVTFQKYLLTCYQKEINKIVDSYDKVIFVLNHPTAVGVFDSCASTTWASHHVSKDKKIILNFSLPYIASDYYPDEKCIVNTNLSLTKYTAPVIAKQLSDVKSFVGKANIEINLRG